MAQSGKRRRFVKGGRLERILSSLAREWLGITNGLLLTVEDPESALGGPKTSSYTWAGLRDKVARAQKGSKRWTETHLVASHFHRSGICSCDRRTPRSSEKAVSRGKLRIE
jgi:hypothetical protein